MAKWRVEKSRESVDWLYPWTTISPEGEHLDWSTWGAAMNHVDIEFAFSPNSNEEESMPKTLADMSIAERAACVGMWCECKMPNGDFIAVLLNSDGLLIFPSLLKSGTLEIGLITPRFDLPRAWGKDGQPPAGHYEEANGGWDNDVDEPYHWPMRSAACNEYCSPFDKMPAEYRRWVTKWEPVEGESNE